MLSPLSHDKCVSLLLSPIRDRSTLEPQSRASVSRSYYESYREHLFTHPSSVCDKHEPVRVAPRSLLAMGEIHVT